MKPRGYTGLVHIGQKGSADLLRLASHDLRHDARAAARRNCAHRRSAKLTAIGNEQALLTTATLVLTLDVIGTFVFAISGAASGVKHRLDVFGVTLLAFVAGNAGGMMRDVLIGAVPPAAINRWPYFAASLVAGLTTFLWHPGVKRVGHIVILFDAAGLAVFAVAGTQKALAFNVHPVAAALLGMLTGIGGGMLRDLLVNEIPVVLRAELYAVAALAGATVVVAGHIFKWSSEPTAVAGALVCFAMRFVAIRRGWRLPVARDVES